MLISELIQKLSEFKEKHGDVPAINSFHFHEGEWDETGEHRIEEITHVKGVEVLSEKDQRRWNKFNIGFENKTVTHCLLDG